VRIGAQSCAACGTLLVVAYRPLTPGQQLAQGRYTIQRALSKGAMGAIYLATDHEAFNRIVVVKALLDHASHDDPAEEQAARERFAQEARTLAGLKHPTIPQIFSYFHDGPHTYIVMEYIEGDDLEGHLSGRSEASGALRSGRPYPRAEVIRWGVTLCNTLDYLARRRPHPVIHHDIKPANLVLDRNSSTIRLVDFGTAKARVLLHADGSVGLQKSSTFGTQGYAPPEQYRGQSEPRSDIYALAATLYHLLTDDDPGEHPFEFPHLASLGYLGEVLGGALAHEIEQRPTAAQLRQQLETLLLPSGAHPIQTPDGTLVHNELELAAWCEQHWGRAAHWLYNRLPEQIELVWGRTRLAQEMRHLLHTHDADRYAALDAVLALLDPQGFGSAAPTLSADQATLNFGAIAVDASSERTLALVNSGRRYVRARLQLPAWLSAEHHAVAMLPGAQATLRLTTDLHHAPLAGSFDDEIAINQDSTPLLQVRAESFTSRWRTLWKSYPRRTAAVLALLLVAVCALTFWGINQSIAAQHYEAGASALQRGDWQAARRDLTPIAGYHDAETLLHESYYRPGKAALERGDWEAARRDLAALLDLHSDYRDTADLLHESYYRPARAALQRGDWETARRAFREIPGYLDAETLLHESYYRPGKAALEHGDWQAARREFFHIPYYRNTATLLQESYYRPGHAALQRGDWPAARSAFAHISGYRDASELLNESYYRAGEAAVARGDWQAARREFGQIPGYRDANTRLKETYYQPLRHAIETRQWNTAAELLLELETLDRAYRDVPLLLTTHRDLMRAVAVRRAATWQDGTAYQQHSLAAHTDNVHAVAFSPNGQLLASASWDTTIGIWDMESGELLRQLYGHEKYVSSVAFSPDGQTLASASADQTVRLWRVHDGELLHTLTGHEKYVSSVAFSPDGHMLASGSWDTNIGLWRVGDGELLRVLRDHSAVVEDVAFSPDGHMLASASWDETVGLWRVGDGELLRALRGHTDHVSSVAFSPDGQTLASGSWDETIRLWNVSDGTHQRALVGHRDEVRSVAFSPDGQTLASASGGLDNDTTVRLWSIASGTLLQTLPGHRGWVHSVAFSPDGQTLASGSFDDTILLWQAGR
jgi:serine/threonine protein kinase/outer membrane protein assembly factor BamD (BamD/ComL family)/sugar lactone lactonase YvrE